MAARIGNFVALEFMFEMWNEPAYRDLRYNVNTKDKNGHTALFEACRRCCLGSEDIRESDPKKLNRLNICKLLVKNGADVDVRSLFVNMTPLHWAAFNNDHLTVEFLLQKRAPQIPSKNGNYPVDIAGFCGHKNVVKIICGILKKRVQLEKAGGPKAVSGSVRIDIDSLNNDKNTGSSGKIMPMNINESNSTPDGGMDSAV